MRTMRDSRNGLSPVSRRDLLAGGVAVAGGTLIGSPTPARAQATPHVFQLGTAEFTVVSDGKMSVPLSFVLPQADPQAVATLLASRGQSGSAYAAQINITIVKVAGAVIVIDSGGSTDFMPDMGRFADQLNLAGVKAADVTHMILTHAHPDHLWGLIDPLDDDSRFPDARHVMTIAERDHWLQPGIEDKAPDAMKGITLGIVRRLKSVAKRIDAVKSGAEILPGVTLVDTPGHTPGHTSVLFSFGGQSLLVGGDALSHPVVSFERPDWVWGADVDPQRAVATRKRLLDQLATDRVGLIGYHLPWPGLGRVERKDAGYRFVQG